MKKTILLFFAALLVLSSCNKDEFDKIVVQIEGLIINEKTGEVVEDAEVMVLTNGKEKSVFSNENGYFNLGELTQGDYVVTVKRDSFLTVSRTITSYGSYRFDGNSKTIENVEISVPPLSETLNFTVYRRYLGNQRLAAINVPFTLYLGKYMNPIQGTTDGNGLIHLENMPYTYSNNYMQLTFDFEVEGIRYKDEISYYNVLSSDYITVYGYIEEGDFGIASTNLLDSKGAEVVDFDVTNDIYINFTQPVDTTDIDENDFYFSNSVSFTISWSNNSMTLNVNIDGDLMHNREYRFSISNYLTNYNKTQSIGSQSFDFFTEE